MSPQRSDRQLTLSTSGAAVDDLRRRLEDTRWPDDVTDEGWAARMPISAQRELVDRWMSLDWLTRETELNHNDHRLVTVDGMQIHAVWHRGKGPDPLPLVITHGWPSSFYEWHRVVGPLTDPETYGGDPADAFDVVTPSLPGYGSSPAPPVSGTTPRDIAALWVEVMAAFGYDRFGAQGCDWGSFVTSFLGLDHPDHMIGVHMGMVSLGVPRDPAVPPSVEEKEYARRFRVWRGAEHGYVAIQSSKPQTLATTLVDSPAGMAARIAEKWSAWSDRHDDGNLMVPGTTSSRRRRSTGTPPPSAAPIACTTKAPRSRRVLRPVSASRCRPDSCSKRLHTSAWRSVGAERPPRTGSVRLPVRASSKPSTSRGGRRRRPGPFFPCPRDDRPVRGRAAGILPTPQISIRFIQQISVKEPS